MECDKEKRIRGGGDLCKTRGPIDDSCECCDDEWFKMVVARVDCSSGDACCKMRMQAAGNGYTTIVCSSVVEEEQYEFD